MTKPSKPVSRPAALITVDLVDDDGDWSAIADIDDLVQRAADAVADAHADRQGVALVSVALSSDAHVAALNAQYRGKASPTNVLSFPANKGAPADFLGDIILAHETILREADAQETPVAHHLQHLVVHGILHLLGYDHETSADAERMEALEISILKNIGIANPYTGALETGTKD